MVGLHDHVVHPEYVTVFRRGFRHTHTHRERHRTAREREREREREKEKHRDRSISCVGLWNRDAAMNS